MNRKWLGVVLVALMLVWGGTAMASVGGFGDKMSQAARASDCGDAHPVGLFPYFVDNAPERAWYGGLYVVNTSGTNDIPAEALCFVGVGEAGDMFNTPFPAGPLNRNQSDSFLIRTLDEDESKWRDILYLGIYAKNQEVVEMLDGFAAFGSMFNRAQGGMFGATFMDAEATPSKKMRFNYLAGGNVAVWWAGVVLWNTSTTDVATVNMTIVEDGQKIALPTQTIDAGKYKLFLPKHMGGIEQWAGNKNVTMDIESTQPLYGYAQYGNRRGTNGYFPIYLD